jgi:hypothetical protein
MGACTHALPAGDAHVVIDRDMVAGTIIAVLYRAGTDTGVAVDAFFRVHFDNLGQRGRDHGDVVLVGAGHVGLWICGA